MLPPVSVKLLDAVDREVREGHRPVGLLDAVGRALVVADGIGAARDLAVGVLVAVLEGEQRAVRRVDEAFPRAEIARDPARDDPGEPVADPVSDGDRDELQPGRLA